MTSLRRRIVLGVLVAMIGLVSYVWAYYLVTRQPIADALPLTNTATRGMQPHYLFSIFGVQAPVGVAVSPDGDRIYVSESEGERMIRAYDRDGKELASFAPPGSQTGTRAPLYIALDASGRVNVSDNIRHTVDIYDSGGNFKASLKPFTSDGWSPLGLRVRGNDMYVTDLTEGQHRVLAAGQDGQLSVQFGREGQAEGELSFPNALIVDSHDRIYVSDSNNGRVQVFDKSGNLLYVIPGFTLPRGMAMDAVQRLYVVDTVGQHIRVFDASKDKAEPLFTFGDFGLSNGEFNFPNDIAIDGAGRLYITDRASNRVQVWVY